MTQRREVLSQPKPSAFTISENAMIRVESLKRLTGLALATTMLAGAPVAQAADTRTALQAALQARRSLATARGGVRGVGALGLAAVSRQPLVGRQKKER